jgi:ubiquinone/menaquinone biosynthesis C-methylase UbiE
MRTTPLGLCASATLLRNSPAQNRAIKDAYRIVASRVRFYLLCLVRDSDRMWANARI